MTAVYNAMFDDMLNFVWIDPESTGLYVEKYIKDKNSPWLVFLHGFGGSTKMWKKQIDEFKENYNLCFIDLPGHGQSAAGIKYKHIRKFDKVADIIVETLRNHGITKATFLCVSLGSLIFAGIFKKYPEMVEKAILCGAVSGINVVCHTLLGFVNAIKHLLPYMVILKFFAYILMPFKSHRKSREFFINSGKLLGRSEFMAWFSLFVHDLNALKNLNGLRDKVLFVTGSEDFVFISGVKKKYKKLKDANLKILKRCGHVCNIQKWSEFNHIALSYIDAVYFKK